MLVSDVAGFAIAAMVAIWLVNPTSLNSVSVAVTVGVVVGISVLTTWVSGLYASIVRYMGANLFVAGIKNTTVATILVSATCYFLGLVTAPFRWGLAFLLVSTLMLVGSRLVARLFLNRSNRERAPVLVYGAGEGGARLVAALFSGDDYLPVGLVDDDPAVHGKRVHGLRIFSPAELPQVIQNTMATGVLLAIPSAARRRRREILERLSEFPVHVQTVPEIRDLVSGAARVDDIREVDVKDILGRKEVPPNRELLNASIAGKAVMVTGAGGSIGSELCRQIIAMRPKRLVLLDMSEPQLYAIAKSLDSALDRGAGTDLVPLLGSVQDESRMRDAMETFGIETVYHAAAYKHVPIVEYNLIEGIRNNVFGTLRTARAAITAKVDSFVLVSTDKAVNPTSAMGATKRLSELVLQALNTSNDVCFSMVRFGNVLGSSGSVVPLFREQIRNGGPVTVTHRDMIRYFMTIPEAAQLVLQAGSMANGGDVFVLDMGEPVRISDLARRMINLMGLTVREEENPDGDIEIQYVGLRPAEKLYEELLIGTNVSGTSHPRIMRASEDFWPIDTLTELLARLANAADSRDQAAAKAVLHEAVQEYDSQSGIYDLVWLNRQRSGESTDAKIVEFPNKT